jgi:hypothetical protein
MFGGGILGYLIVAYGIAALLYFKALKRRSALGFGLFCGGLHLVLITISMGLAAWVRTGELCELLVLLPIMLDMPISLLFLFALSDIPAPAWVADARAWDNLYLPALFLMTLGTLQAFGIGWGGSHAWAALKRRLVQDPPEQAGGEPES